MNPSKRRIALLVSASLVLATVQTGSADAGRQWTPAPSLQTADEPPDQLDQLVAPIALYPDSLVAQILAASTWPNELVEADRWIQQHSGLKDTELAQAVNLQAWDSSVKALTQFPFVLANMDTNLSWSSSLGNAYASDPQGVLHAIQIMRRRAQQAGSLMHTPGEIVTYEGDTIIIQPANAATVYLPEYNPWLVYGTPLAAYPGWYDSPGLSTTNPDILFGLGVGIGAFAGFAWGWNHWQPDWRGRGVVYDDRPYRSYGRSFTDHPVFHANPTAFTHAGNHDVLGFNRGRIGGGFAARGRLGFGGGYHVATGGFHGGGRR
jgi:hypothetical protein